MNRFKPLDQLIHAPVRLAVMTLLVSVRSADFVFLKEATGATDGNLSAHLAKLEEGGLIKIDKRFVKRKPKTTCRITQKGVKAYREYVQSLEQYISNP